MRNTSSKYKKNSLRMQIGLLYTLLAFVNIVFFSVMIFENQSDLLIQSFQLQSENLANTVISDLSSTVIDLDNEEETTLFSQRIGNYEAATFRIFSYQGDILFSGLDPDHYFPNLEEWISNNLSDLNPSDQSSIFKSRYKLELNENDFSLLLTLPIRTKNSKNSFLQAIIIFSGLQERLSQIYIFMGIATGWGIVFHLLFGIFVYRSIFRRLNRLKKASDAMSSGDLSARAHWNRRRSDELDILGDSFNDMAKSIQEKMNTISRLNFEINQELKIGKEVQELFLPSRKDFDRFKIGRFYLPLREVSGDIYFFQKIGEGDEEKYFFFLADVSGHGVSASLITVTISLFLESIVKETCDPVVIIGKLNQLMSIRLQSSFFATAVAILISRNHMVSCNAGHNPPILFQDKGDSVGEISSSGPPLGMNENHQYEAWETILDPGDKILCYTDGLVETLDREGVMFGISRVKSMIQAGFNETTSNQAIVEAIALSLDQNKAEYKDDVTILLWEIPKF